MNRNQSPKPRMSKTNPEFAEATRTRHAAAARPHRLKTSYSRKPKHRGRGYEE